MCSAAGVSAGRCSPRGARLHTQFVQVREHIQRTQCTEISWRELCTICNNVAQESIREMISEYASFDIWTVEHDANGQPRLLVDQAD